MVTENRDDDDCYEGVEIRHDVYRHFSFLLSLRIRDPLSCQDFGEWKGKKKKARVTSFVYDQLTPMPLTLT
jgi:hypothetical protein